MGVRYRARLPPARPSACTHPAAPSPPTRPPTHPATHSPTHPPPSPGTYAREVAEAPSVVAALARVRGAAADAEARCTAFAARFAQYDHLWRGDMLVELQRFLAAPGGGQGEGAPPRARACRRAG